MKTAQHTPTPWEVTDMGLTYSEDKVIGDLNSFTGPNAAFIVRAVNSFDKNEKELEFLRNCHKEMVKALKDVLFVLKGQAQAGNYFDSSERDISLEGVVEEAIAKAEAV